MNDKSRKGKESGKGGNGEKQRSPYHHAIITEHELITLKTVLYGYLGFLSHIGEPEALEKRARLQAVHDRLSQHLGVGEALYFEYEERIAILEAVIGFKVLLITAFPQTTQRDLALADVERLYQCLIHERTLPLN